MPRGLNNKVALITGAAQGIGRGIALRLAQEGVHIALVDLHQEKLNTVQQEIEAFGVKATTFIADISDPIQVSHAIDHAESTLNGFDIMINNAGIAQVKALAEVTPSEFNKIMNINVGGVLWGFKPQQINLNNANRLEKLLMPAQSQVMRVLLSSVFIQQLNLQFVH